MPVLAIGKTLLDSFWNTLMDSYCYGIFFFFLSASLLPGTIRWASGPGSSYIFCTPVLESAIFSKTLFSDKNWRMVLEIKIWVLSTLMATGVLMFLALSTERVKICMCIYYPMHVCIYFYKAISLYKCTYIHTHI